MHPNEDEIRAARRVMNDAGFACIRVTEHATWLAEYVRDLDDDGFAVTASTGDLLDVADQVVAIKKSFKPELAE